MHLIVSFEAVLDLLKAVVHAQKLRNVIYSKVSSVLKDPRRREEAWPNVYAVHTLCFGVVKKSGHSTDLFEFLRTHCLFNNHVKKRECNRMVFHAHGLEVI